MSCHERQTVHWFPFASHGQFRSLKNVVLCSNPFLALCDWPNVQVDRKRRPRNTSWRANCPAGIHLCINIFVDQSLGVPPTYCKHLSRLPLFSPPGPAQVTSATNKRCQRPVGAPVGTSSGRRYAGSPRGTCGRL